MREAALVPEVQPTFADYSATVLVFSDASRAVTLPESVTGNGASSTGRSASRRPPPARSRLNLSSISTRTTMLQPLNRTRAIQTTVRRNRYCRKRAETQPLLPKGLERPTKCISAGINQFLGGPPVMFFRRGQNRWTESVMGTQCLCHLNKTRIIQVAQTSGCGAPPSPSVLCFPGKPVRQCAVGPSVNACPPCCSPPSMSAGVTAWWGCP